MINKGDEITWASGGFYDPHDGTPLLMLRGRVFKATPTSMLVIPEGSSMRRFVDPRSGLTTIRPQMVVVCVSHVLTHTSAGTQLQEETACRTE